MVGVVRTSLDTRVVATRVTDDLVSSALAKASTIIREARDRAAAEAAEAQVRI